MNKFFLLAMICFSAVQVFAQDADAPLSSKNAPAGGGGFLAAPAQRGDIWVCPGAETAFYSSSGVSIGGSLSAAYGSKFSFGFRTAWFFDMNNELDALEINFLLRYYFLDGGENALSAKAAPSLENAPSGPYLQLTGGPALFFDKAESAALPAKWGTVSAGLAFGWRFLFGKLFFAEPYIRAGYPYIIGAGVSGGVRF